jgi:drug/metabolite transporter (DMT)-like permease
VLGILFALMAACAGAVSAILLKSITSKVDPVSINTIRLWVGSILLVAIVLITGREIGQLHLAPILVIALAGILSLAIGDTTYIRSISYLDVSLAFPISQANSPVLTLIVAVLFLNESFTWVNVIGALAVLVGVFMIVRPRRMGGKNVRKGATYALLAAVFWAAGSIALKIGSTGFDPIVVAGIRALASALVLTTIVFASKSQTRLLPVLNSKNLVLIAIAGMLSY